MQAIQFLTKVKLPQRRPDVLRRSRLVDFLHQHVDRRVILVCTPAGYGKTTLLVDFAQDVGIPVCWFSMDPADADLRTFFEYLLLSLRQRFPNFGKQTEALLDSVNDAGKDTLSIVASLANEIQSDIPDYFLLVLDDYHCVDDSAPVNAALDLLIGYLPDNCHLAISSRTLPHITYSSLAAQRLISGLGTSDLRFTAEELARLLRGNYNLAISTPQVEQLIEASEGWITGILLTTHTLWMGLVESLIKAKGTGSPLFDYLANEAYLQLPPEVQRFLLCSSVLNQMTPALCDRLFAEGSAAEMLRQLVRANLFIVELEGPEEWYRYHNLFQDFLQAKLKADEPDLYRQLHFRAAEIAEAERQWDRAFDHYQRSGAAESGAGLVERVGEEMMRSGHWQTLYRWLAALPAETIDTRAKLSLFRGRSHLWSGEVDRAIAHLDRATDRYRSMGNPTEAGGALTLKSVGLRMKGRLKEALDACAEALALQTDPDSPVAAEAHRHTGVCLASQGKFAEAAVELQRALQVYEALGDESGVPLVCQSMGILFVRKGDLARGMAFYRKALAAWQRSGSAASTAGVLNCIASVHHHTGEYPQALQMLEEALAKARESGNLHSEANALAGLGDVRRDSGNPQASIESYEAALDLAQRIDEISLVNYVLDALANTHRLLGDYATAERLLRQALQQAEESQSPHEAAAYSITAGVLAEEQGDLDHAAALLRDTVGHLSASGTAHDLARAHFHYAHTLFSLGDRAGAATQLEASLELCRQLGYDQFMVAEGQRAREFLAWATGRGIGGRRLELVAGRLHRSRPAEQPARRTPLRLEVAEPKHIEVYALGQARVMVDSRVVTTSDWTVEKTKELFFFLLEQPHSLRKEQIVDVLWPELEEGKSNSQFHSTMYRLRRALFPQCVAFHDGRYGLTLGRGLWFDAEEFGRLLNEADSPGLRPPQQMERLESALDLYKGPYLDEFYTDWAASRREELEHRFLRAGMRLAKLKAEAGALEEAIALLRSVVATDPFQEDAHCGMIHYAALMDDRAGALNHFRDYVALLREELGARPSPRIQTLADRIAKGQPLPPL